jgi:DNA methylase
MPARPAAIDESPSPPEPAYWTDLGTMYQASVEEFLGSMAGEVIRGEVQLIFTSPPFPLNEKKRYGNRIGKQYVDWLVSLAEPLGDLLADDGSLVVELGNAWEPRKPVMSTLGLKALLSLQEAGGFHLCQQFVVHNPARLPSPAQWVTVERIRVKDSYTHVWWMSRTERPKADNRRVLTDYSQAMRKLLERQSYNPGRRPSEHVIGQTSFLTDHGGAIPPNVLKMPDETAPEFENMLPISNTVSTDAYRRYCRENDLPLHPARMAPDLAEFFIRFLTDEKDLVLDPFAGSNTTGWVAEQLGRQWIALEPEAHYIAGSRGRFEPGSLQDALS